MSPDEFQSISNVYRLLSRLWLSEVDTELLLCLSTTSTDGAFLVSPVMANDSSFVEQLAIDYCGLLIGPKDHLPPYQSVWEEAQFQGEYADSVKSFATAVRLEKLGSVVADHLGCQLQIMGHVTELLSRSSDDTDLVELAADFFARHLGWPDRLLSAAGRKAESDFYRSMIGLTTDLLESERKYWVRS